MTSGALTPDLNELRASAWRPTSAASAAPRCACTSPSRRSPSAGLARGEGRARLLERSYRGVALTPAGRRLYGKRARCSDSADQVADVMVGIRHTGALVRLAASHSATEAFVADAPARNDDGSCRWSS
jgi:DNA-binding transcriptional LysR family regulator